MPMRRNVRLYPWYRMTGDAMAWMPVFFLYFSEYLTVADVLRLEALYYFAVVSLEVPSGYFSDAVGRRITLILSAGAFVFAYFFFLIGSGFDLFAIAQVLLAAGMAFRSGTDTSFHYDSLAALSSQREFAGREARVQRASLTATALAVLAGGIAGSFNLAIAYALSLAAALVSLVIACLFSEPQRPAGHDAVPGFIMQLVVCARYLRNPALAWLFVFSVVLFVLAHVPYEFYQPYLQLLDADGMLGRSDAPSVSGMLMSFTMLIGAWAAGRSVSWRDRVGLGVLLLAAGFLQLLVIAGLGSWLHAGVVALVLFRNMPMAMVRAPVNAAIVPRVATTQRATYLSIQSLASRLAFAALLASLSFSVDKAAMDWQSLSFILRLCAGVGLASLLLLLVSIKSLRDEKQAADACDSV